MFKKRLIILSPLILVVIILILRFLIGGPEDNWICSNGGWVKHGNPSASMPTQSCGDALKNNQQTENKITDIKVTKPQPNEIISSPLEIEGEARGTWFFEASFPVKLLDSSGAEIAKGIAQAKSDWMTEDFVPFTATLQFNVPVETKGILILEKDNPSGLPENADELRVPVIIASTEMTTIRVYFNNNKLDPEISCNKVFSVERKIIKTEAIGRAALEELLKGATEEEKAQGFFSSINSGVKIQKLIIDNGTAKIDFDKQLEFQVGGSCRVSAIRAQIVETLKQFPTVKNVVISIDGRIEDILQP
ncbi:MAG: GerMN domain-containing protein [Patescibacteria group bacterium]|nr:GerMN domain-containing protein [Patescibacteria group bacterium]MDD5534594.1 GerMN domain-containing protein [Patescibacteria group bacterium]